ncbi:hypothetical protein ONV78_17305 [Hahella sp. CR1]|uniref:hypothetical protein n=1 Tax=Hahella sp. CR1 TaxID=2992807 RepID=UPI0024426250|nr:hypothetical protein [Hahella sp. CR1]MDG9669501.1 hypothetical protein [Hahella sp. CR1]
MFQHFVDDHWRNISDEKAASIDAITECIAAKLLKLKELHVVADYLPNVTDQATKCVWALQTLNSLIGSTGYSKFYLYAEYELTRLDDLLCNESKT